jgi:C4-dicarboxylate transporter
MLTYMQMIEMKGWKRESFYTGMGIGFFGLVILIIAGSVSI